MKTTSLKKLGEGSKKKVRPKLRSMRTVTFNNEIQTSKSRLSKDGSNDEGDRKSIKLGTKNAHDEKLLNQMQPSDNLLR